ncbi:MAG: hypothetical protein EOP37_03290 [Rubrivivax sp.]|nr:MAG: hypothetical protein EOP37_03290 [Rubrivivax sp.]
MKVTMELMEQLLLEWASWLTVGDGSGYARLSVLHEDWSPPTPGQSPTLKSVRPDSARRMHRLIETQLSMRLRNTLVVSYVVGGSLSDQANRLGCRPDTIRGRVTIAKRQLMQHLADSG